MPAPHGNHELESCQRQIHVSSLYEPALIPGHLDIRPAALNLGLPLFSFGDEAVSLIAGNVSQRAFEGSGPAAAMHVIVVICTQSFDV